MAKLVDSKETIAVLQRTNFQFKKQFGQNFLIDASVLDHIISYAKIQKEDLVIEIGPGIGTLTEALCEHAGQVIAIEIDDKRISTYVEIKALFDEAVQKDLDGMSDPKIKDHFKNTVDLKSKVFKALLKNTDGFFNPLFK